MNFKCVLLTMSEIIYKSIKQMCIVLLKKNKFFYLFGHLLRGLLGGEPVPGVGLDGVGVAADSEHDDGVGGNGARQPCPAASGQLLECRRHLQGRDNKISYTKYYIQKQPYCTMNHVHCVVVPVFFGSLRSLNTAFLKYW